MNGNLQAFPSADNRGLTKREWLVGLALQGLCSNPDIVRRLNELGEISSADAVAGHAIRLADATVRRMS